MELRSRLSTRNSEVEIDINKEDICYGSRNSSLPVGSADSDHHFACTLLSLEGRTKLEGRIKTVPPAYGRGTELASLLKPGSSLAGTRLNSLETFMSLGTILLIVLVIALLGGFSGLGGGPFYGTGYYGGGGLGLVLVVVLILVLLGRI
jgi:hypothetical protein